MRKWFRTSALIVMLIAAGGICVHEARRSGPVYQGKTADEWFDLAAQTAKTATRDEVKKAFVAMGAPAVPVLEKNYLKAASANGDKLIILWSLSPSFIKRHMREPLVPYLAAETARDIVLDLPAQSRRAFAQRVLPYLILRFESGNAVGAFGGRADLLERYILELQPDAASILPVLNKALSDKDSEVRSVAGEALKKFGQTQTK